MQSCHWVLVSERIGTKIFIFIALLTSTAVLILPGCSGIKVSPPVVPTTQTLAQELVLYNWVDYMPQIVLDEFESEFGVKVIIKTYASQDEALKNIVDGTVTFDVAVVDSDILPQLVRSNLVAEIDYHEIPNFVNISADFRDLTYDPGNQYSIPYNWGTSGLIVRSDLLDSPITKWVDLWDPRYAGKIGIRNEPTEIISIALLSLGYLLNTEDPAQLEAALERLLELKRNITFIPADAESAVEALNSGDIIILQGWNGDALVAREQNPEIEYVLPEEGTMLWSDSFVISASSSNLQTAEAFLNFILRPEISAQIVETYYYPSANETARLFIDPAILNDLVVYPPPSYLKRNHFYAPLSEKGQKLYEDIWERFLDGYP